MSKRHNKTARPSPSVRTGDHSTSQPAQNVSASFAGVAPPAAAHIQQLIAGKHSKAAVEAAKDLHKRAATAGSEKLLIAAYTARIRDLLNLGMGVEAKSLLSLVRERFPAAHAALNDLEFELCVSSGSLDELVAPLQNPELAQPIRDRIETLIRQRVDDLPALAQASSLSPTHPLREGAAALVLAFQAVTSGPVEETALLLPQVSRRSPLASWKALIQAIACFYRGEDQACAKWLKAIAPDSVPARLLPSMQTMLGVTSAGPAGAPAARLLDAVGSSPKLLANALATLERALVEGKKKPILEATRAAVHLCGSCSPGMVEKLRKHIAVRCMLLELDADTVFGAIGRFSKDAYWHRLLGRAFEESKGGGDRAEAIFAWEGFRACAITENWFAPKSLEDGVLSLHMAQLAEHLSEGEIDTLCSYRFEDHDRFRSIGSLFGKNLAFPGKLYERACEADAHPDAFQKWLNWAKKLQDGKIADYAAAAWHQAHPRDVEPLLWLMESAEKRSAFKKSLSFLEEAERLDRLNPEVRKFKLRLMTAAAMRSLAQGKPHLAAQAIERMAALPEEQYGKLSPVISAFNLVCSTLNNELDAARCCKIELEKQLGSPGAYLLHSCVVRAARPNAHGVSVSSPQPVSLDGMEGAGLLKDLSRACDLGNLIGAPLTLPSQWMQPLIRAFADCGGALDIVQLLGMGEAALHSRLRHLAFVISGAGLARGGADARFLFLRARSFAPTASERHSYCLICALELARRDRDMDLAVKILDGLQPNFKTSYGGNSRFRGGDFSRDNFSMEPKLVNQVLEEERKDNQLPADGARSLPNYVRQRENGKSRSRGGAGGWPRTEFDPFESDHDEMDDDSEEKIFDVLDELTKTLPSDLLNDVLEAAARGETPDQFYSRKAAEGTGTREASPHPGKNQRQKPRNPPPEQASLF